MANQFLCSVSDCGKPTKSRACPYCHRHYRINLRHGSPLAVKKRHTDPGETYSWLLQHVGHNGEECLEWPFTIHSAGYGVVQVGDKKRIASTVMCELVHGEKPTKEHQAAHFCGYRRCINPNHIRWATPSENQLDRVAHGTSNRGARHGLSKLTAAKVLQIRHMAASGLTHKAIAEQMGISRSHISGVASRTYWNWLP